MAVHAGVFYFDGRPTDEERRWLATNTQPAAPSALFAKDGLVMTCVGPPVWSGQEASERLVRSESGLVLVWDGRLDNRDDLRLRLDGSFARDTSDAAIALSAFERWGLDGLRALTGDWSLAIWDSRQRTLHLARDYMGVRPLYYYIDQHAVLWSSNLGELAVRSGRVDDLNEVFVARFMSLRSSTDVTPYVGIRAVPTATCVSITGDGAERRHAYWQLSPGYVRYGDHREYEEHLRELWTEAVGVRLRTEGTVWAELSGGLDSSSVVCMADALIGDRRVPANALQPLSHVTTESPEGDERRFIAEVEAKIGQRSEILGVEEHLHVRDTRWDWVTPRATEGVQVASHDLMRARGGRVILSGRLGDLVMGCAPDNSVAVFDDLADGHPLVALAKMHAWSRVRRVPFLAIASQLARDGARAMRGRPFWFSASDTQTAGGRLLADGLHARVGEDALPQWDRLSTRLSQRETYYSVELTSRQAQLEVQADPSSVTYSFPFSHRPLVEFMLSIPGEQLSAPGELRSLMRRAFCGLVPDRILRRISKGYYPPAILRATRSIAPMLLPVTSAGVVRRGWVDSSRLEVAVRTLLDGGSITAKEVYRVMRLEQWLVSRDRWGPTATPQRKEVKTNEVLSA